MVLTKNVWGNPGHQERDFQNLVIWCLLFALLFNNLYDQNLFSMSTLYLCQYSALLWGSSREETMTGWAADQRAGAQAGDLPASQDLALILDLTEAIVQVHKLFQSSTRSGSTSQLSILAPALPPLPPWFPCVGGLTLAQCFPPSSPSISSSPTSSLLSFPTSRLLQWAHTDTGND